MREIIDEKLIEDYIDQYQIREYFDNKEIDFQLFEYEKGELLSDIKKPIHYIQFLVKGTIQIYDLQANGNMLPLRQVNSLTVLGDLELSNDGLQSLWIEAREQTLCLAISMKRYKEQLLGDNRFLRCMLQSVSQKLSLFSKAEMSCQTIEEKLLDYVTNQCPNQTMAGINEVTFQLRCSRRQLQRALKQLTEKQLLHKLGRGKYCLTT